MADASGVHEKIPVPELKVAVGASPAAEIVTGRPAGSLADTLKVTGWPGRVSCAPGVLSTGAAGLTVIVSWTEYPPKAAEIAAVVGCVTVVVLASKERIDNPDGEVTAVGTTTCKLLLVRVTELAIVGAELNFNWQLKEDKAFTGLGAHESATGRSTTSDSDTCTDTLPSVAVIVTGSS